MLHALLIDDEPSARADLRAKLGAERGVEVVGEAATLRSARALLTGTDYNVVFLDVQLIGGTSFELVPLVRPGASIIFATAHESFALRAFESRAVDYLLKPIDPSRLAAALGRVAGAVAANTSGCTAAPARAARPTAPTSVQSASPFPPPAADGVHEMGFTSDERSFLRQMLEAWEESLPSTHLLREHRTGVRVVRYDRATGMARLFLMGTPASALRRWWRLFRP